MAVLLLAVSGASFEARADYSGRVAKVHDGDTVTVLAGGAQRRVRLVGIDAPERGQPYASASRRALAARVAGRDVTVSERGVDSHGRTLGLVLVFGESANVAQVRDGWAWVFRRFENDAALLALEAEARAAGRGLWRDASPVPPWIWRETHPRKPIPSRPPNPAPPAAPIVR